MPFIIYIGDLMCSVFIQINLCFQFETFIDLCVIHTINIEFIQSLTIIFKYFLRYG